MQSSFSFCYSAKTLTRNNQGKKGFIPAYISRSRSMMQRSQRRGEAGTETDKSWRMLPTGLLLMAGLACFVIHTTQSSLPRSGIAYSGLSPLTSLVDQMLPTGQSEGGIFSAEVPSSQMTPTWVKLTGKKPKHRRCVSQNTWTLLSTWGPHY